MPKAKDPAQSSADKILTIQVHHEALNPRTFKVPLSWLHRASALAWILLGISIVASVFAAKEYFSERLARPELIQELENEVQELKIALEKRGNAPAPVNTAEGVAKIDPKASDEKPAPGPGVVLEEKGGVWSGLAENVAPPPPASESMIKLEDPKLDWQGKYANFTLNVLYKEPGKGSQQGHIVVLGRANDRVFAHPEGVMNTATGAYLFDPNRGEYFSVARFRVLKARLGPFESNRQLADVQVFLFDQNNKLIMMQNYAYGSKQ